jgi:tRNA uracil 4-sulfurtransferase
VTDRLYVLRLSGDFYVKARQTRLRFLRRLSRNVEDALASHGLPGRLDQTWSRLYLNSPAPEVPEIVARVFGIQSVSEAVRLPWGDFDDVVREATAFFAPHVAGRRFAVRASRRGRRDVIPFDSPQVERAVGSALLPGAAGVDLARPEVTAHVEVEPGQVHLFLDRTGGFGGLPVGVEGRAVALISGGFDSAVAAWLLLKRGVQLDYLFCNLGGDAHRAGVERVLAVLAERWSYGSGPRLHEIDLRPLVLQIRERTQSRNWQILLKRLMLRAAESVARHGSAAGLVTGDAIGQVSSQTLQNLAAISQAAALPVLRPLLGFNKEEILELARRIGVYGPASEVPEYCGLAATRTATRARLDAVLAQEAKLDLDALRQAVAERRIRDLREPLPRKPVSRRAAGSRSTAAAAFPATAQTAGQTDGQIGPDQVLIDLRPLAAFRSWHYPGALHLEFGQALAAYSSFGRAARYVLVCEVGWKSDQLAGLMREAGLDARAFPGGLRELARLAEREGVSERPAGFS